MGLPLSSRTLVGKWTRLISHVCKVMVTQYQFSQLKLGEFCDLITGDQPLLFKEVLTPSQLRLCEFPRFCQVLGDVEVRVRTGFYARAYPHQERVEHDQLLSDYYLKSQQEVDPLTSTSQPLTQQAVDPLTQQAVDPLTQQPPPYVGKNVMLHQYFSRLGLNGIPGTLFETFPQGTFWLGGSDTKTPLHKDAPHNLALQLCGTKQWTLFSRSDSHLLCYPLNNNELEWSEYQLEKPETCPSAREATPIMVTLHPGDLLFVPSLWSHHVENLTNSIMVNYFFKTFLPDGRPHLKWQTLC